MTVYNTVNWDWNQEVPDYLITIGPCDLQEQDEDQDWEDAFMQWADENKDWVRHLSLKANYTDVDIDNYYCNYQAVDLDNYYYDLLK